MKGPVFWYAREGREAAPLTRTLLTPLAWLYGWAGARRMARAQPERAPVPVICIGNLTLGGAGKTPVAQAVLGRLRAMGAPAAALSRGHGGREAGPLRVDPDRHDADAVGDEPLLHARAGPAFVARDRAAGARMAAEAGARIVVMDDGFQNPSLAKDLNILVIDAEAGHGNGRVFPAGPLREPVVRGLRRAQAAVLILPHPDFAPNRRALGLDGFAGPVLTAWLEPEGPPPAGPLVAFAGIGRPQKFFDSLRRSGAEIVEEVPFGDHHRYRPSDAVFLTRLADRAGARLVTTEKDFARLPPDLRGQCAAWPVRARFADPAALDALLTPLMDAAPQAG